MKFLKTFILTTIAIVALMLSNSSAQTFQGIDFLEGIRSVQLTNNTTYNFGASLIGYTNNQGASVYSLTNLYSTNGLITPGTVLTNSYASYPAAWKDVPLFSDRNGNPASASFALTWSGDTARSTNTITVTVSKLTRDIDANGNKIYLPGTQTVDKWTFAVAGTQAQGGIITNIPAAMMQGAAGLRVGPIVISDASAASSINILSMSVNGYVP